MYSDLNEQQIDSHYNCTVNLTGNTVKKDSSALCALCIYILCAFSVYYTQYVC